LSFINGVITTRNTISHKDACLPAIPDALDVDLLRHRGVTHAIP